LIDHEDWMEKSCQGEKSKCAYNLLSACTLKLGWKVILKWKQIASNKVHKKWI
jgi:hypothetical protein